MEPHSCCLLFIVNQVFKGFSPEALIGILVICILLLCSALISGSEISFFSLGPKEISEMEKLEHKKDKAILHVLSSPKMLLAAILIGNNIVNLAIVILSSFTINIILDFTDFPVLGFFIQVVLITFMLLLFGEIIPKIVASQLPMRFARFIVNPVIIMVKFLKPLAFLLVKSTNFIDKRIKKREYNISMDEISDALEITKHDITREEDRKILKSIVKFGDIDVKEIMKSRLDITAISYDLNFNDVLKSVTDCGFSRIPVYKENIDHICGVIYIKDLLPHMNKIQSFLWQNLIRQPYFVPESKKINDLLQELKASKIHMAIVVDEFGGTSGIVTLEDIIEEIVGEINDEFDSEELVYSKINENSYIFEAKAQINEFIKIFELDNDFFAAISGEFDTLAGLLLELKGEIPVRNDKIVYKYFVFQIESADKKRIKRIKVTVNKPESQKNENIP